MSAQKRKVSYITDIDETSGIPSTSKRRLDASGSSTLPIPPTDNPSSRSPPFQQPYQLMTFSYASVTSPEDPSKRSRALEWNNSSMKYYVPPPQGANLAYGYERWIKRPEERGRLDGLLEACIKDQCEGERRRADLITWRGVITKILTAPYEERDGWDLNIMCIDETMYLEEHSSDVKLQEKSNIHGKQRLMTYYGYSFESYCTSDTPPDRSGNAVTRTPNGWGGDVDTNEQWCSVVKTKLGPFRIIIGGEVDCVRGTMVPVKPNDDEYQVKPKDRYTGQPDTFMELKTSISIRSGNTGDEMRFEKKLLKFYFQSFLLGVPEILVGFRSPSGYLQTTQSFRTMDLPRMVRGKPGAWDPSVCLSWGDRVFDFIRTHTRHVTNSDEKAIWRVSFRPNVGLSIKLLGQEEGDDVRGGEDRIGFLPRWYWERLKGTEVTEGGPHRGHPFDNEDRVHSQSVSHTVASVEKGDGPVRGWEV